MVFTRTHCDAVNEGMLDLVKSEAHLVACTNAMDVTKGTVKLKVKAAVELDKLN